MNQIRHIQKLNEEELKSGTTASWHDQVPRPASQPLLITTTLTLLDALHDGQYKDSAYVNVGGLPINLTEGDVITIFSQCAQVPHPLRPQSPRAKVLTTCAP